MKKVLKFVTLAAVAMVLALLPNANATKSLAAPNTYWLKYDVNNNDWYYQIGEWKDDGYANTSYYLNNGDSKVKDGDVVVVMGNDANADGPAIKINAHLSNLTFLCVNGIVYANGIDDCYILKNCSASVNADVTNAYVYDDAVCNFNQNVTNLHLISTEKNTVDNRVAVVGTVAYVSIENPGGILNEYYNFAANSFRFDLGTGLSTAEDKFSRTGSGPVVPAASTAQPEPTADPASTPASPSANNDYDDVPKTGDSNPIPLLLSVSAICFAGCLMLRKKED